MIVCVNDGCEESTLSFENNTQILNDLYTP